MEIESNRTACKEFEALLEDHLTGELSGADARKLAEHLEMCIACSVALEETIPSVRLLQAGEETRDPGPGFSRAVMARIREEMSRRSEEKSIWQPFIALAWRFSATATLALALLVTFDAIWHSRDGIHQTLALTPATETRDLFPDPATPPASGDEALMMVVESSHGKH